MPFLIANTYVAGRTNLLVLYNHLLERLGSKEAVKAFLDDYKNELKIYDNEDYDVYPQDFDFDNAELAEKCTAFYGVQITSFQDYARSEGAHLYTTYNFEEDLLQVAKAEVIDFYEYIDYIGYKIVIITANATC